MDTSKQVFQLHGVNAAEEPVLRGKLRRKEMVAFFQRLEPTVVGIEACGGAHHWARVLQEFGHQVKLLPPKYAKAYVKRGKNDAADAEALCEAMSRPTMRFVAAKTAEQQAAQMLAGTRDRLIRRRTQLTNAIRGYAAEFGLIAARGIDKIEPLLARLQAEPTLPALARELFAWHEGIRPVASAAGGDRRQADGLAPAERTEPASSEDPRHRADRRHPVGHESRPTQSLPIRPAFRGVDRADTKGSLDGRQDPARRHHPRRRRGLAQRAGGRRDRGDPAGAARQSLPLAGNRGPALAVAGRAAEAQIAQLAAVALANKMARIAWKLMVSGQHYNPAHVVSAGMDKAA